ncbi:hypothetical protein XU18_3462 [Perkinsela sp. CCAP 1560/4]|nr:hypothetical protein XU18_3462 [Perkinsela sp. CCAP 1560/4]|eukprot:KNH05491.1 hypothetical protein XU18_3462 [Perkinsela sp. CCAP 1560/4]
MIDCTFDDDSAARRDGDIQAVVRSQKEICALHFGLRDYAALQKPLMRLVGKADDEAETTCLEETMFTRSQHGAELPS